MGGTPRNNVLKLYIDINATYLEKACGQVNISSGEDIRHIYTLRVGLETLVDEGRMKEFQSFGQIVDGERSCIREYG